MGLRVLVRACALVLIAALVPGAVASAQEQPRGIENFCPPGEVPPSGFTDIAGNPHAPAIECVAFYDIALGTTATTYSPRMPVRRAQMASFIARFVDQFADAFGVMLPADPPHAFADVPADSPHALRINQLADVEIVGGFVDGTYRPGATVTRDGMASFINRALEFLTGEALDGPPGQFTDTAGNPHEDNINGLAAAGVVAGFGDGTYRPRDPVFRDQMASFIARSGDLLSEVAFTDFFFALLLGQAEVDDSVPGQPRFGQGEDGPFGVAFVALNSDTGLVCRDLFFLVEPEAEFTGMHIHEGRMYENGPIVVDLGDAAVESDCVEDDPETVAAVEADPSNHYVNVHTEDFPAGAARGQLGVAAMLGFPLGVWEVDDSEEDEFHFGQGEEGAEGLALTMVDLFHEEICVYGRTTATPPFTGMHIHEGPMNENGDIVVGLNEPDPVSRESSTCLDDVEGDLLEALVFDRANYYVNIHTAQFPAGAVRSQLDAPALEVPLSADEVTDGGEEGATGTHWGQADFMTATVCHYTVTDATGPFVGHHIHEGVRGEDGPILVELAEPDDDTGVVSECLQLDEETFFSIGADPESLARHYVQIHTEDHPAGAVRGQMIDGLELQFRLLRGES